jgi:hypothetical protein
MVPWRMIDQVLHMDIAIDNQYDSEWSVEQERRSARRVMAYSIGEKISGHRAYTASSDSCCPYFAGLRHTRSAATNCDFPPYGRSLGNPTTELRAILVAGAGIACERTPIQ